MAGTGDLSKFSYQPIQIDPAVNTLNIRIITIQPGTSSDDIKCTISNHSSTYAALSYTWGPPVLSRAITLNGFHFPVRENLWLALQHLRLEDRERIIWIDALCINQDDIDERNSQVAQMGKVYEQAKEVLVWLGLEDLGLETNAFTILKKLQEDIAWRRDTPFWQGLICQWYADPENKTTAQPAWQALVALCGLDYWKRLWIIQEIVLGNNIRLFWGQGSLSWDEFFSLLDQVSLVEDHEEVGLEFRKTSAVVTDSMPFQLAGQKIGGGKVYTFGRDDIVDLIMSYQESQCYDPRDKVFGMSGITGSKIKVDYSKSLAEICADVLREKFSRFNELSIADGKAKPWRGDWDVENLNTVSSGGVLLEILQGARIELKDVFKAKVTDDKTDVVYSATANISGVIYFITDPLDSYRERSVDSIAHEVLQNKDGEWLNTLIRQQLSFLNKELIQSPESWVKKLRESNEYVCVSITEKVSHIEEPPTDPQLPSKGKNPLTQLDKKPWRESCETWRFEEQEYARDGGMSPGEMVAQLILTTASEMPLQTVSETRMFFSSSGLIGFAPKNAKEGDRICTFRESRSLVVIRRDEVKNREAIIGLASSLDEDIMEKSDMLVKAGRMGEGEVPDQMIRCYLSMKTLLLICWFRCAYAVSKPVARKEIMNWVRAGANVSKPLPFPKRRLNPYMR